MGALKGLATAILLAGQAPAASQIAPLTTSSPPHRPDELQIDRWRSQIREASARFGIPEAWIRRVIHAESGGRVKLAGHPITSRAGAMGLMQLMPGTWADMRSNYGLGPDPHDPRNNIFAGTAYLRSMYDRFGYPGLFAAYNAGPGRYSEYLAGGGPLPAETAAYLAALGRDQPGQSRAPAAIAGGGDLFVRLSNAIPRDSDSALPVPTAAGSGSGLFARLESISAPPQ